MQNILITGGAGFIGTKLSLALKSKGYNITILDNLSPQVHGENAKLPSELVGKVNFIKGSVLNKTDLEKSLINQDVIVHLAAETGTGQSMYEITKYVNVNIDGTANILEVLGQKNFPIKKVIVASSRAIYGEGKYKCENHGIVYPLSRIEIDMINGDFDVKCPICRENVTVVATDESSLIHPTSIYGITKQTQENLIMLGCKSIGIPAVALRYQNVYGPGQSLSNPYTGILSIFSTRIQNGNAINIFEDGSETRDFIYIDDVVQATINAIEMQSADNHIFNVGTGIQTTVLEVANKLKEFSESKTELEITGNFRLGDIRHNFADISLLKDLLNFQPRFSFDEGIKLFFEWVQTQQVSQDNYDKSIEEMKSKGLYK